MGQDLRELIVETQKQFRIKPSAAKATFAADSELKDGLCCSAKMRHHEMLIDEPAALGGDDRGPNPVELVLAALGTCQEITYRAYAAAMGIPLEGVSVTFEGDIDLRGFFAVDENVRPGYEAIRGTVRLVSSASEGELQTLQAAVNAHCPVLDMLNEPVPVSISMEYQAVAAE